MDGDSHNRGGVERIDHRHVLREVLLEFPDSLGDSLRGLQRIGPVGQGHGQPGGCFAVEAGEEAVVFRADFDARYILKVHRGAIGLRLEQDVAKFLGALQQGLRGDRDVKLLVLHRWRATELAGGNFGILRGDGAGDIRSIKAVGVELLRVQPDTHGMLRTKQLHAANPLHTADRIKHVRRDIVREVVVGHAVIVGDEAQHHQKVRVGLGHRDALRLHDTGQFRRGQLQLVLYLNLSDIRIGAGFESQRDGGTTRRIAGRGHICQAVDALHILLDHLGDGVFNGRGRGARISGGDAHLRGRYVRILRDGELHDGQRARHHDDDGNHPGKNGPINKKT